MSGDADASRTIRIAAAGDVHVHEASRARVENAFGDLDGVDLVLLAGDLTANGRLEEAFVLADACRPLPIPVVAVLGNHDWHCGEQERIEEALSEAGVRILDRGASTIVDSAGGTVGVVGSKGFVGGFVDSRLPDFGEPLLRRMYAETTAEVDGLERGLAEVSDCDVRLVLLHYAPTPTTIEGERMAIWPFLGSDRMAAPIAKHLPDLVLHGHAHAGRFDGWIGEVPVYNVALSVMRRDFWVFELAAGRSRPAAEPQR